MSDEPLSSKLGIGGFAGGISAALDASRLLAGVRTWARAHGLAAVALGAILLAALLLRVSHLNWDKGQHLHPDERFLSFVSADIKPPASIGQYFDSRASPLNPYNYGDSFVYGTFPIFLNKALAEWLDRDQDGSTHATADLLRDVLRPFGVSMERPDGSLTFDAGYDSNQIGRALSAIADVLTVLLVFEMGRVLHSRRVGLVAAGLLSVTVLHIQYAHFFGSETFLALFVTATVYFSVRISRYDSAWNYVFAGGAYGLALATKLSALPVLIVPALAIGVRAWPYVQPWLRSQLSGRVPPGSPSTRECAGLLASLVGGGLFFLLATGLVFRVAEPYAFDSRNFLDVIDVDLSLKEDVFNLKALARLEPLWPTHYLNFSEKFEADIANLRNQQKGADFPPNVQWINRTPVLFPLGNIALWGLGLPLALGVGGSLAYVAFRLVRRGDGTLLLPFVWVVFDFLFLARTFNPTMRYFIAIYPSLVLIGAYGLVSLWDTVRSGRALMLPGRLARLAPATAPLARAAVGIVLLGTALWGLAFTGIYRQDISRVQASYWIAQNLPSGSRLSYQEWDDGVPLGLPGITPANYAHVVLKPYAEDSEEKVLELVAGLDQVDYVVETSNRLYGSIPRFPARYPSTTLYYKHLFDGSLGFEKVAEFTNYPRLLGIEIPDQSAEEAFTVYDHPKVTIWRKTAAYSHDRALALLQPDRGAAAVKLPPAKAARNGLMLRPGELATQRRGGTWTSVFSDRGLAVSDPTLLWLLALEGAALAVTPLTLALFRRLPDRGYLMAKPLGLLLLAYPVWLLTSLKLTHFDQTVIAATLVTLLAVGGVAAGRTRRELSDFLRRNWRLVLFSEVLFLVAFFFLRELRLANPDLWEASRGGEKPMDMAYFTAVTRSTTLPPYDPWFAGGYINYYYLGHFFAATLTKLTTIPPEFAFNLAVPTFFSLTVAAAFSVCYNLAAVVQGRLRRRPGRRPIASWGAYVAGLLGVFFVALTGNLDGLDQLSERLSAVSGWHFETSLPLLGAVVNGIGGAWQVLFHGAGLAPFDFWRSSRMLPPTISITEFPYFSFLFADLHAHMMAIPFEVLTLGIALTLAVWPKGERGGREWALVALLALVVGSLRWLNSWDYPPFLLLALAAVAIGERRLEGGLVSVGVRLGGKAVMLIVLSFAFFLPFLDSYQTPFSGFDSAPEKTPLHQYLAHFGVLAAISAAWLVYLALRAVKATPLRRFWRPANAGEEMWLLAAAGCFAVLMLICAGLILEDRGFVAALLPALALVAYLGWRELRQRRPDGGARLFVLALIGLGLGLSIGVDLVVIKGDIVRMNTVFKFYLHTWTAFAVAASFAAWQLLFVVWPRAVFLRGWRVPRFAAVGGGLGLAGLALAAAVYPLFATPPRLNDRFAELPNTLDGMAYMRGAIYEDEGLPLRLAYDYEGIQWLRRNVQGTPAIVEGRTPLYRWGGRFSIYTGLPAVLGWDWHQVQQRGDLGYLVNERGNQVDQFYASPDVAQALSFLRRYDVEYVIVGEVERLYYTPEGLRKIEAGLDGALERVFENAGLTIYKVKGPGRPVVAEASP